MNHLKAHILVPDSNSFSLKRNILNHETNRIHSHENFEMNYIINGWGTRIIGDSIESFSKGDLVLIGPDLPHCWEIKGIPQGLTPECITIHFHADFLGQKFIQSPELKPMYDLIKEARLGIQFSGNEITEVYQIFDKIFKANPFRKLMYLLEIFEKLICTKEKRILARAGFVEDTTAIANKKLNRVYEYILANFTKKIRLEEVAELAYLSPGAFCRFFERTTGKTLFTYLKEVRIGYACKLLQETELSVSNICYESGFNNLSHFNNQFKEICKYTPGQYRKNLKMVN